MGEAAQTWTPETQLFRDVFNASPIGIAVESLEGQPLFVNPAFCSFLGFNEEELRNKHCVDFSPREDAEKDWALFQQLRAGSIDHYQLEKRYFRRDGSLVWGSLSISLLKSSPSPLVLAMVENITDKKKAEEARFRHAAVIESSDDAIASATLDGIILSWNTGAQKIYGYTEAEAVGKAVSMLVPPELPDEENKILETLRAGSRIEHFETVRVTKTGKRINVSLTISPIKDSSGRTVGCSGIARDITERKLAEEALRASEERLRLAQQAARIGTFDWNIRTGVNTWTPELEAMYGLPPGGFGGTQTAFENLVHPDDRAGVIKLVDAAMKSGQPTKGEWRVVWADGSVHWIAGRWQVFMAASGEPSKMIGVNIDVTERKRAEEALLGMSRKLIEAHEQERTRIGRDLHDDVVQRLALLSIELDGVQQDIPDAASELRTRIEALRDQTTRITNDVQLLSHELHFSKLDYLGVVGAAKNFCKEFSEQHKVEIDFQSHDLPTALPTDLSLSLFRVLQEAVRNATKHSGVKRFEVRLWGSTGEINLTVSDLGAGFDQEAAMKSTGLGLTSMQERLRLVHGELSIKSQPKGGTTIHARVPFEPRSDSARAAG
jgi:PAS domain S-box-containing protein